MTRIPSRHAVVALLLAWSTGLFSVLLATSWKDPVDRAIAVMALGLFLVWVVGGGGLMIRFRTTWLRYVRRIPGGWRLRFVACCTLLALIEEAVATLMTNLGPLLGDLTGRARITASPDYLEVVTRHSVVVFVPMFIGWAALLSWRYFPPFAVFLLFGITGLLAEVLAFGPANLLGAGFWMLVYGLMIYLPACAAPAGHVPPARPWHYPLAIIVPLLCAVPVVISVNRCVTW